MNILNIIKRNYGKAMLKTFRKFLPSKGFRWLRVHWARMTSRNIDKRANIQRGAFISGDGYNLFVGNYATIGINCKITSNCIIGSGTMMGPDCLIIMHNHKYDNNRHEITKGFNVKEAIIGENAGSEPGHFFTWCKDRQ